MTVPDLIVDKTSRFQTYLRILNDLGCEPPRDSFIIDFGCGSGNLVRSCRDAGYAAYGCDIRFPDELETASLRAKGLLREIRTAPYVLPFDDGEADLLISDQVLEHVADFGEALSEMHRVLKPGGVMLHLFPSRYAPIEPHVFVPFATIIRSSWWLRLWASLGVRNSFQRGLSAAETARRNRQYLTSSTFYRTKKQLYAEVSRYFDDVSFCELQFLKQSRRGRTIYRLSPFFPFLPALYGLLRSRVLFARKTPFPASAREGGVR